MKNLSTKQVIDIAAQHIKGLAGHEFDLLSVSKPVSPEAALNLSKIISKLSPLLGNLIEFNICEYLSDKPEFDGIGEWRRQDPGFPDTIFVGNIAPIPGLEVKAWFPLATEITARFKDSQNAFLKDNTYVAIIAWLPQNLIYGKPYIVDCAVFSGSSVAKARDNHYHNPPDYLVLEPEDTSSRTSNLQQTNTNGFKFQGTPDQLVEAQKIVESWGENGHKYQTSPEYQRKLKKLYGSFSYRGDTNYAKMDRIVHSGLEDFKQKVMASDVKGLRVSDWQRLFSSKDEDKIQQYLKSHLGITEVDADLLRK